MSTLYNSQKEQQWSRHQLSFCVCLVTCHLLSPCTREERSKTACLPTEKVISQIFQCTGQKQKSESLIICKSILNERWPCIYAAMVTVYVVDTFGVSSLIISLSEEHASINSSSVTAPSESLQETNSNKGEVGLLDLLTVISTSKWLYEWVSHWWVPNVLNC